MLALARPLVYLVLLAFAGAAVLPAPSFFPPLPPGAEAGWNEYATLTGQRVERELKDPKRFLALDFTASGAADRRAVLNGQMPVASMVTTRPNGRSINVPDGWVHHWRGAVLLRGARLDQVFQRLQQEVPGTGKGDVVASRILPRDGPQMRVFMKVQRAGRFIVAYHLVYNTEHDVTFTRRSALRASSTTVATKIAELYHPGSPEEREFAAGEGNRFLERWNSYWRYDEVPAGVIAECESITLSQDLPFGLGWTRSLVDGAARDSMEKALVNVRDHFAAPGRMPPASSPAR